MKKFSKQFQKGKTIALIFLLCGVIYATGIWYEGYQVDYGTTQTVNGGNNGLICKKVTNNSSNGKAIFVPTKTDSEMNTFIGNHPSDVSINECCNPNNRGGWSACSASCGGGNQTRTNECGTSQSQSCNTQSCCNPNNWGNWSACSASCGGGNQTRTNECGTSQSQSCNTQSCCNPNNWGVWTCVNSTATRTNQCGTSQTSSCDNNVCRGASFCSSYGTKDTCLYNEDCAAACSTMYGTPGYEPCKTTCYNRDHTSCVWIPNQTYTISEGSQRTCSVWVSSQSNTMWGMSYPRWKDLKQTYTNGARGPCILEQGSMCGTMYTAGACPSGTTCKSYYFGVGSSQSDCYNKYKNAAGMVMEGSNAYYKHPNGYKIWLSYYNNQCISIYYHCLP